MIKNRSMQVAESHHNLCLEAKSFFAFVSNLIERAANVNDKPLQ